MLKKKCEVVYVFIYYLVWWFVNMVRVGVKIIEKKLMNEVFIIVMGNIVGDKYIRY